MTCDGAVVCTRCGNGECGRGENICNCPADCGGSVSACEQEGGYCEHFEMDCREGFEGGAPMGCPQGRSAQCCLPAGPDCTEPADCLVREWRLDCWGSWSCEEGSCVEKCPGACGDGECVEQQGEDRKTCFPDCGAQCASGQERQYLCPDGSSVPWCTCQAGLWLCVRSPESQCRDTICDDGTEPICLAETPECQPWEILAVKNGCWECVLPDTCEPWGLPVCERDAMCAVTEKCEDCGQPVCPSCSACIPACVPHNCPTEDMALCKMLRPDCEAGQVAVVKDNCWLCVDEQTCKPPQTGCVAEGDVIPVIPDAPECCDGLTRIGCESLTADGQCMPVPPGCGGICTRCGDGQCGHGENQCNCAADCEQAPECQPGEEVPHVCPDGQMVPWCTCENGQWACIISPENGCRDSSCDDGTQPMCPMAMPMCEQWEILAYQNHCFSCVNPATCLPWSQDACESDRECPVEERCDGCGSSSCPSCRDCVAACVAHGCHTEEIAFCNTPRTACADGEVSVVRDGCWQCVSLDTCEPPPRPECEEKGGYCTHFMEDCGDGYESSATTLGCPMGRSGQCCLPVQPECRVPSDCAELFWDIRCYGHWSCREGQCEEVCDYEGCGDGICDVTGGETETSCRPDCGQECVDGELKGHVCPDGSEVPWCTCAAGRWSCIKSPENACRDSSCDDGKPLACRRPIPICKDFEILAYQEGCYACVNPVSCKPWGVPGCASDTGCAPEDHCDDCATSSGPDLDDCVAACLPHGCETEHEVACNCIRPECGQGQVAVVVDGCWQCVGLNACQPTGQGCGPDTGP
jgi:hypothetical protein